jgi:hypothetical protein
MSLQYFGRHTNNLDMYEKNQIFNYNVHME